MLNSNQRGQQPPTQLFFEGSTSEYMPENPSFLSKKYPDLHSSPEVEAASRRTEEKTGERIPASRHEQRIQNYLAYLQEIIETQDTHLREEKIRRIKQVLYGRYVIKPEDIPDSCFDTQRRMAREQGHGNIEITEETRRQAAENIIADQRSTLDRWIDYLTDPTAPYPDWLKYWAIRSVLGIAEYDKEKKAFGKRRKDTVKPFPDLDREALAFVLDAIEKKYAERDLDLVALQTFDDESRQVLKILLQGENFAKLYAFAIEKVTPAQREQLEDIRGEWVRYPKGSDHMPLVQSLQGHGTGWCTAGESTAEIQLQAGDFYVYYSLDRQGKPTVPRAAIRMQENSIAEVRGIAPDQNLDPYIAQSTVLKDKLALFGEEGKRYQKRSEDMRRLTELDKKLVKRDKDGHITTKLAHEPTREELIFLYEIDSPIQGFGYQSDPRIKELRETRNIKKDFAYIFSCSESEISTTQREALKGNIKFHYGSLNLEGLTTAEGLKLPDSVGGYLYQSIRSFILCLHSMGLSPNAISTANL